MIQLGHYYAQQNNFNGAFELFKRAWDEGDQRGRTMIIKFQNNFQIPRGMLLKPNEGEQIEPAESLILDNRPRLL